MTKLQPLTVGPILGHVSDKTARVFGRAEYLPAPGALPPGWGVQSHGLFQSCFGVARIRPVGNSEFQPPKFFAMNPNFDMSGVVTFEGLKPATEYEYQVGWVVSEKELDSSVNLD